MAWPPALFGRPQIRRLAASDFPFAGRPDLRLLLGNVELLFVSQMDLSHAGDTVPARVRNAAARIRRIHSLCAGAVRVEEFPLATRAAAAIVKSGGRKVGRNAVLEGLESGGEEGFITARRFSYRPITPSLLSPFTNHDSLGCGLLLHSRAWLLIPPGISLG